MKNLKKKTTLIFSIFLSMALTPLLAVGSEAGQILETPQEKIHADIPQEKAPPVPEKENSHFTILDGETEKILKIPEKEFLYGTVAAEMPVSFETEALKAQAVAAHTYFLRGKDLHSKLENKPEHEFTMNTTRGNGWYRNENYLKTKWGEKFPENYGKIKNAVDAVFDEVLKHGNDYALTLYHAMSSGKTEKCCDVFSQDLEYLTNVESEGDKFVSGYESTLEVTPREFRKLIEEKFEDIKFQGKPGSWCKKLSRTDGGMVKEIEICSKKIKGTEIRWLFKLRSANFDLIFNGEKFIFKVRGHGHGVGLSQHGANYMAKEGRDYKQILQAYYPGTMLSSI